MSERAAPVPALRAVETRLIRIPLARPWGADVTDLRVIAVTVHDADGGVGHAFTWTPTIGGTAVKALLDDDLVPAAIGRPADPGVWHDLWRHVHEAGGGGVTTIALAGLDLALWDLRARRAGACVTDLLGRRHDRLPAYGSGVNLHYPIDELVAQARRWVAAGFQAVKIKVGSPDLGRDLERVAAVRAVLGPDRRLMVDANQRWDLETAARSIPALAEYGIDWIEEPLRADDLAGYRALRARIDVPVAAGENLHTVHRFRDFLDAGALDVVQPNIVRVGGITPFLEIADLARERGVELAPHLLPELSAQVAYALPETSWVEDVEDAGFATLGALVEPSGVTIADGWASGGPALGLGLRFA
ncbi:mandelate racemase/muconate lactonizing enzyme family protein [Microbacterium marinilacus]|uniref:Mandelate racemase/muconate lactonizing enzyme family protein n=1 Tax=Microbacterium marinilacus TaxID=415209 RepID=A0ABP7BAF6_9MICO|nr:mandelate racemase/muconate lactonizing enzyme family protein [Microbacterium marinilacus]MBY0687278.1 mandelate racemase/muconate lactonizing enzyme family protein [Microbacterium marinilacus]